MRAEQNVSIEIVESIESSSSTETVVSVDTVKGMEEFSIQCDRDDKHFSF